MAQESLGYRVEVYPPDEGGAILLEKCKLTKTSGINPYTLVFHTDRHFVYCRQVGKKGDIGPVFLRVVKKAKSSEVFMIHFDKWAKNFTPDYPRVYHSFDPTTRAIKNLVWGMITQK